MSDGPDPFRQCHHGVVRLPGEFVSLVLYDETYQQTRE